MVWLDKQSLIHLPVKIVQILPTEYFIMPSRLKEFVKLTVKLRRQTSSHDAEILLSTRDRPACLSTYFVFPIKKEHS
jgi:hypothetical protein